MSNEVTNTFQLDGVRFNIDIRPGVEREQSSDDEFVLVKTQTFIDFYTELKERAPSTILEVGMFEGGSLVLFDKLFNPARLVGIDIRGPIAPLENYRVDKPHISTHYNLSQDDPRLSTLLTTEFPDGIDLVVDDASHMYELSRDTFHLAFPHVRPGGLYVIEDWSWSHKVNHQESSHPWYDKPALTNLILELIFSLPRGGQISNVSVHRDLVVVEKAPGSRGQVDLTGAIDGLRGRALPQL